jgi:hydrogenase-1 operon protein HyaF
VSINDIPVRVIGPGSQPGEADGQTLDPLGMPSDIWTYQPPSMPEPDEVRNLDGARESMRWLQAALARVTSTGQPELANLTALDAENRELVNQILDEGEVCVTYNGAVRANTQEAILAGIWRTVYLRDDGSVIADILEVGDVPHTVRIPDGRDRPIDTSSDNVPEGVVNALSILVELEAHCEAFEKDGKRREINLTLLPLSDADLEFLDARLGRGPIDTLSRAYGNCQVVSTLSPNVWWTRYTNSMGKPILNTIEVVEVPEVLKAAPDDLEDSAKRLDEILAPYWAPDA